MLGLNCQFPAEDIPDFLQLRAFNIVTTHNFALAWSSDQHILSQANSSLTTQPSPCRPLLYLGVAIVSRRVRFLGLEPLVVSLPLCQAVSTLSYCSPL